MKYLKENGELKVSRAWNLGITCLCFVSVHLSVFVYFHFPPVWTAAEWWRSCFSNPCFLCSLLPPVFDLSFDSRRRKHKKSFGPILPFSFPPAIFCLSFDAGIWYKTQIQKTKKILDSEKYKTRMQNKWKIVDSGLTWWTKHALPNFPEQDRRSWGGRLWHCALCTALKASWHRGNYFDGFFFR